MEATMLDLMHAVCAMISCMDALADELSAAANLLDGEPSADIMRGLARCHRVDMLKLQAQAAALSAATTEWPNLYP